MGKSFTSKTKIKDLHNRIDKQGRQNMKAVQPLAYRKNKESKQ